MDISGECGTFQGWSRACQWFTHLRSETQRKKMSRCAVVVRRLSVVHELTVHGPRRKPSSGLRFGGSYRAHWWFRWLSESRVKGDPLVGHAA